MTTEVLAGHAVTRAALRAREADRVLREFIAAEAHPALIRDAAHALINCWIDLGYAKAIHGKFRSWNGSVMVRSARNATRRAAHA